MLGLKLNHVSKRGHSWLKYLLEAGIGLSYISKWQDGTTTALLKLGNRYIISPHALMGMHYLSMLGLRLIHVSEKGTMSVTVVATAAITADCMFYWLTKIRSSPSLITDHWKRSMVIMMTSSNGNIFRVTGHLCGEFTGHRWIPHTHKGQWRGALMFSFICVWINGWVNNRKARDLRCYRSHYDVIVMVKTIEGH